MTITIEMEDGVIQVTRKGYPGEAPKQEYFFGMYGKDEKTYEGLAENWKNISCMIVADLMACAHQHRDKGGSLT